MLVFLAALVYCVVVFVFVVECRECPLSAGLNCPIWENLANCTVNWTVVEVEIVISRDPHAIKLESVQASVSFSIPELVILFVPASASV